MLSTVSASNWRLPRAFAICLCRDWTLCCCNWLTFKSLKGVQDAVRHSVLRGNWWDRSSSPVQFSSGAQLFWFFATPWTAAQQAFLSITNSWSLLKLVSIESVMPPNHLILCRPLHLPPSIFPMIRVFSSESVLCIRWPKYWSFSLRISPSNEYSGLISFRID